jgi:hypothetical protein
VVARIEQRLGVSGSGGGFTHLGGGIVEAHDARAHVGELCCRHHEGFSVERVKALRDVSRELQMLHLILADGDDGGLVEQNVGGHQDRVLEYSIAHGFLSGGFGFELRHAFEPSHGRDAGEEPGQFGVGGYGGLDNDARVLRVDAGGQEERSQFADFSAQLVGLLVDRDGVQIDDAEDAFEIVLNADPVGEGSEVVADVQITGRLNARQDAGNHFELGVKRLW